MVKERLAQLGIYIACAAFVLALLPVRVLRAPVGPGSNPVVASFPDKPPASAKPVRAWSTVATWYGVEFAGQETADGELFNMYALTAAHPTLPLGSLIRIIYPKTGRSLVVRINDRGPFVEGRGLDVTYGVARALGFVQKGFARVRVELLEVPRHWTVEATQN